MKILFIVPYAPTLIRTRSYNLLRALKRRGHTLTLATLCENQVERQALQELAGQGIEVIAFPLAKRRIALNLVQGLLSRDSLQAHYCWQPTLMQAAKQALVNRSFDVVHVEHLRGAKYGLRIQDEIRNLNLTLPVVWDSVDCISLLFEQAAQHSRSGFGRWVTRIELPRTRHFEGWLATQFDHTVITSPIDRQALLNLVKEGCQPAPVTVVPNGVDITYFSPEKEIEREPDMIVLSGKMSYHANVTMALFLINEIMPIIWAKKKNVKVYLVGKEPPPTIKSLSNNPNVVVTGTVPDIRSYLRKASLSIVPMIYGAGSQFKVLEAMACGTPVVATPQAVSALENMQPGRDALVAGDADGLAQVVLDLLDNPDLRQQVGENGLAYVRRWHDWDTIAEKLEGIYREVIERKRGLLHKERSQ